MQQPPLIVDAGASEAEVMAALLADAFSADPVMNWVIPQAGLYRDFFRLLLEDVFLPRGIRHLETDNRGAGLWLPPDVHFHIPTSTTLISLIARLLLRKGPQPLLRIAQQNRRFIKHQPKAPHYHLVFVGCRQSAQGLGVGSALIKQGLRICDREKMPAYLESSNRLNVPLYQRHGFEVVAEERLPGGGPSIWFMWRDAR
jgi:GNAT superfamily N-acetyltransferase